MSNLTQEINEKLYMYNEGVVYGIESTVRKTVSYEYLVADDDLFKRYIIKLYLALYDYYASKQDALCWLLECGVSGMVTTKVKTLIENFEKMLEENEVV